MRLAGSRAAAFLRDPSRARVVLLYGDDVGLIRERSKAIIRAVLGIADDPFRLVTVERANEIAVEAAGASLGGGRRVVRVPDATEAMRDAVSTALEAPGDAIVLLEASGLSPSRSRLLKLIDASADTVAIACYRARSDAFMNLVRGWLRERRVSIDEQALSWLSTRLGADTALSQAEIEKLALYVGPDGRADLAAAQASVGDVAGLALDDALFAATAGECETADRALERVLAEGTPAVSVIRAGLTHLQRLERAALSVAAGMSPSDAAKAAHVFFRHVPAFTRALALWSPASVAEALKNFFQGEQDAKHTGVPALSLCRHLVAELALEARAARETPARAS